MKLALLIANSIFSVFSLIMFVIALGFTLNLNVIVNIVRDVVVGNFVMGSAVCLVVTIALGILAGATGSKFYLGIFGFLIIVCHVLHLTVSAFCFLESIYLTEVIEITLKEKYIIYHSNNTNNDVDKTIDEMQKKWRCCGYPDVTDYEAFPLPSSCCDLPKTSHWISYCTEKMAFKDDCRLMGKSLLVSSLQASGLLGMACAVAEFFMGLYSMCSAFGELK